MAKIKQIGRTKVYQINCSGCGRVHNINCNPEHHGAWTYSSGSKGPTFKPSLRIIDGKNICEFSITDGQVYFTNNCTHKLRGQTLELPEIKNTL